MKKLLSLRYLLQSPNSIQKKAKFQDIQAEIGRIWYPGGFWQISLKRRYSSTYF